jgi:hypothetical protein
MFRRYVRKWLNPYQVNVKTKEQYKRGVIEMV